MGLKIFLACALGAFTGSLVALSVHPYLWWVGLIGGGLVGYLSYEFREVVAAIQTAWLEIVGYKPSWKDLTRQLWVGFAFLTTFATVVSVAVGWALLLSFFDHRGDSLALLFVAIFGFLFGVVALSPARRWCEMESLSRQEAKRIVLLVNPLSMLVYWPMWTLWRTSVVLRRVIPLIPSLFTKAAGGVRLFSTTVFRLVHSDLRLLCGIDAAIGTVVGYFTGNALIGALAGGVFGLLNYQVVSVWLLKFHRATT